MDDWKQLGTLLDKLKKNLSKRDTSKAWEVEELRKDFETALGLISTAVDNMTVVTNQMGEFAKAVKGRFAKDKQSFHQMVKTFAAIGVAVEAHEARLKAIEANSTKTKKARKAKP